MVLTLANYSCLEQWKRILAVFLTCESALTEVEGYFVEIVRVLREQLGRVEDVDGGLFEMGDEQGSAWLRRLLRTFRRNVNEAFERRESELKTAVKLLEEWLREQFDWEDENNILRRGMLQLEDGEMV
jgi:A1 cistron-splicing factor AAR2